MVLHEPQNSSKDSKDNQTIFDLIFIVFNNDVLVCVEDMLATITVLIRM